MLDSWKEIWLFSISRKKYTKKVKNIVILLIYLANQGNGLVRPTVILHVTAHGQTLLSTMT